VDIKREFRFECVKCGKCCTDENTLVNVTYLDILRIYNALNLSLDELIHILGFYVLKTDFSEENLKKLVINPIKTEKGLAFVGLRKLDDGQCYFYNKIKKKCSIYKIRPNFCRTFPFSFDLISNKEKKSKQDIKIKYTQKGLQYCIGINEKAPLINKEEWKRLGELVLEKLKKNEYISIKWNNSIENRQINPSVRNFLKFILNIDK